MNKIPLFWCFVFFLHFSYSQDKQAPDNYVKTELYFGLSKENGGSVSKKQWKKFVEKEVTQVFAEGMTIFDGNGIWYDEKKKININEKSKVIVAIHVSSDEFSRRIDGLREKYKKLFDQSIVLRTDEKVQVAFE